MSRRRVAGKARPPPRSTPRVLMPPRSKQSLVVTTLAVSLPDSRLFIIRLCFFTHENLRASSKPVP